MKKFYFIVALLCFSIHSYATDYFISKNGNNTNDGKSINTSFLSIQKAADVAIQGDIIYISEGVYREEVNIKTDGITFKPYNNGNVTINGTELLLNWDLNAGNTYSSSMNWNLVSYGSNQIFCDGKMIENTRWPDQLSADIVSPTNAFADDVTTSGNFFIIKDNDFNEPNNRWVGAKIWVNLSHNGVDGQGWTGIVSETNAQLHTITVDFGETPRLGNQPWGLGQNTEYFLFNPTKEGVNATGGIDAVLSNGEWWKDAQTLYLKTPNGLSPSLSESGNNLIEAKRRYFAFLSSNSSSAYSIINLNLFACAINTDVNAKFNRSIRPMHDILLDGIKIKYVSHQTEMSGNWQDEHYNWTGVILSGTNNTIQNCTIEYAATSALSVSGYGNKVLNNTIAHTNYMCSNAGAINTGFVCQDAEIANNVIYNTTMMALNFKYSKNSNLSTPNKYRIHHNTMYDFMRRSGDSGAIDIVGEDGQGIRIDHNLIYNTTPIIGNMVHGIYLDFGGGPGIDIGNFTLDHNVILDVPAPILINNIRYVNIYNNTLMSNTDEYCIVNYNGGKRGVDVKIYNNIMSKGPNVNCCDGVDLALSDVKNNIVNAKGEVLNNLFVNPLAKNYHLIPSATQAIDKGISVGIYDENVIGLPDLGAFEYEEMADNITPSKPLNLIVNKVEAFNMNISWNASSDDKGVTSYEVFVNDLFYTTVADTIVNIANLLPLTTYSIKVRARDAVGNKSESSDAIIIKTTSAGPGFVMMEMWKGVQGTQIINIPLDKKPTETSFITKLELPIDKLDYYGVRIRGYIIPSVSGTYNFYIASDDFGELWLSNDIKLSNIERIAYHTSWTSSQEWFKFPTQKSVSKSLIAGEKYCFEVLMKEGNAGDNLAVAWTTPLSNTISVIGGQNIEAYNADNDVLDVSLVDFKANSTDVGNVLKWSTANEVNNAGFKILKSTDSKKFKEIGFANSKSNNGNSKGFLNYDYTDVEQSEDAYYKLAQTDFDQSIKESKTVFVKRRDLNNSKAKVFPNPTNQSFTAIVFSETTEKFNLTVVSLAGKKMFQKHGKLVKGENAITTNIEQLPAGVYLLFIENESGKYLIKEKIGKY